RHASRTRPPDVRWLPRRNGAGAARTRSRSSLEARFRRERRDLVGALPAVWGGAQIDRRLADGAAMPQTYDCLCALLTFGDNARPWKITARATARAARISSARS